MAFIYEHSSSVIVINTYIVRTFHEKSSSRQVLLAQANVATTELSYIKIVSHMQVKIKWTAIIKYPNRAFWSGRIVESQLKINSHHRLSSSKKILVTLSII